jgi:ATP-dependent Clp protease ATP-binding subunit ClpB
LDEIEEIRRVVQGTPVVLRTNLVIGEPGVGKTAIAEGLAQRIVNGDVPESQNNQLICSGMGGFGTTKYPGRRFRGYRLKAVLKEVTNSEGQIVHIIY